MLSNLSGINYSKIRRKTLDFNDKLRLKETYEKVSKLPIIVEDSGGVTIEHIRSTARQIRRTKGEIAGIFVDYLTKMDIKQEKGQSWSRAVGEVSKKSKWLAQELECPFIMLAQLSREGAKEEPQLHHLRDSGEIEQDADMVEFLWEGEEKSTQGTIVNSTIAKGRETGTRKFKYLFRGHIQRYEDYKLQ
jgi:replicative DNA helicase